jgi:hypothetical protein
MTGFPSHKEHVRSLRIITVVAALIPTISRGKKGEGSSFIMNVHTFTPAPGTMVHNQAL